MIIRISGGNNGVAEYLEKGRKAEREFTRDELDHRLILDGNLDATNKIIQSIENTGQERYLHITLSFLESDVSHDTLKKITEEYKTLMMNAYHQEEYCFYAEAHLPKIKNITNNLTGELVERKPHIHIVIPETNLSTGNKLLPTGKVTMTERYLDAIQEHINYKYGLVSPKDVARVSDNNYSNVLSRTKGDLFRERNSDLKKQILAGLTTNNITSFSEFGHYLKNFGEVKLRNANKDSEYYAVKFAGDSKFTNLKSPLFSVRYVEKRELPFVKPTEKQVLALLTDWKERVSHEVKHIFPKSESIRNKYKSLSDQDKKNFLNERIKIYEQERKPSPKGGRKERNQRSVKQSSRPSLSRRANRLSYMPQRALVYGIRGSSGHSQREWQSAGREAPKRILSPDEHRHLGKSGTKSLHADQAMRWDDAGERPEHARGLKSIHDSSVLHEEFFQHLNQKAQDEEIETMREVRNNIDPIRFLSALSHEFQIVATDYQISKVKDGSPRFQVGKRNMNASDFLTKHMNLSWSDSKELLLKIYSEQQKGLPYERALTRITLTKKQATDRFESFKETQKELKSILRLNRSSLYNEIKDLRSQVYKVSSDEREVARGLIVYHKLTGLENLSELNKKGRDFITDYHAIWNEDKDPMKALQKLKEIINFTDDENGVEAAETTLSIKSRVEAQQRVQELQRTRLKDLVLQKSQDKLVFLNPESEKPVFTDKGVRLIANKDASNDEIALMLEYAKEKFGGVLKLNGDDEFKTKCALIAAEKDMNIIIKPDEFNNLMKQHKADLIANQVQQAEHEQTEPLPEQAVEAASQEFTEVSRNPQQAAPVADIVIDVKEVPVELDYDVLGRLESYHKPLLLDSQDGHFGYLPNVSDIGTTYEVLGHTEGAPEDSFVFATFDTERDAQAFSDIANTLGKTKLAVLIDQHQATHASDVVNEIPLVANDKGADHETAQTLSSLIDEYAQKAESEGLEFFVRDIEQEIISKDMSLDEAKEYLEKEIVLMRTVKEDMQQGNENENVQD